VSALILCGTFASGSRLTTESSGSERVALINDMVDNWGRGHGMEIFAPSLTSEGHAQRFGAFERAVGSPAMVRARFGVITGIDVTPILQTLSAPTLVLHRAGDRAVPRMLAKEMAEAIPGSRYVELTGDDHIPWVGDAEQTLD